jgi:hypothetical protein
LLAGGLPLVGRYFAGLKSAMLFGSSCSLVDIARFGRAVALVLMVWVASASGSLRAVTLAADKSTLTVATSQSVIVQQPVSVAALPGKRVSFGVVTEAPPSSAPLTYQWYFNDQPIVGAAARNAIYSFIVGPARAGHYHVVVGGGATATSEKAELVVYAKPKFVAQPSGVTLDAGQPLVLSAEATGNPAPGYQWFFNDVEIPDATASTYTVDSVDALDTGRYKVRATSVAGTTFSRVVSVVVRSAPLIIDSPVDTDAFVGLPLRLSVTAVGFPQRSYQWRFNGKPIPDANAPVFVLKPALSKTGIYDVVVTNALGSEVSDPFTVTVYAAPKLVAAPVGANKRIGQSHVFKVEAPAYPAPTYQWLKDGEELPGQTFGTLALSPLKLTDEGLYSVRVSNSLGSFTTKAAKLRVSVAPFGPVKSSEYRFDTTVVSDFGDSLRLNMKFTIVNGSVVRIYDYDDNTVSGDKLEFTRIGNDRVRMRFYFSEDGLNMTLATNFYFATPTSGHVVVSVSAAGYGVVATGSSPFTYTEPGL